MVLMLESLIDDRPLSQEVITRYQRERDSLRSVEEKKRQEEEKKKQMLKNLAKARRVKAKNRGN